MQHVPVVIETPLGWPALSKYSFRYYKIKVVSVGYESALWRCGCQQSLPGNVSPVVHRYAHLKEAGVGFYPDVAHADPKQRPPRKSFAAVPDPDSIEEELAGGPIPKPRIKARQKPQPTKQYRPLSGQDLLLVYRLFDQGWTAHKVMKQFHLPETTAYRHWRNWKTRRAAERTAAPSGDPEGSVVSSPPGGDACS
jgi:hypothetical protein